MSVLLPLPDTPVTAVTAPSGMRMSTPLRLCSRAPVSVSHCGPMRRRVVGHRDLALAGEILAR